MYIVTHRKIFYAISSVLVAASIFALVFWGVKPGIDFKGGSLLEVAYGKGAPSAQQVQQALTASGYADASVRSTGTLELRQLGGSYIIRMREMSGDEQAKVTETLRSLSNGVMEIARFTTIGPLLGREAAGKSFIAILLVILCIVLFITFAFRKVSLPVASWKYGIITIIALLHDVLIPAGVFAVLGRFGGVEVDTLFVTALLVVLGFSVHDTIVVFDRVRENLRLSHEVRDRKPFDVIVGESIAQTFVRSINTSLTTVIALVVLYAIGPEVTTHFSLALIIGIVAGTYSSIFIGSPLLVTVEKRQKKV